jgi:tRNA nucleotidyltransferase (CCA-adding enzyme)
MRAEELIATHGNTDFDAFASMLAARRLYPDAVVCVSGSLSRNVREFARLHAEELEVVDVGRLELDAIRRLVVVDTVHAGRLGELEPVARDPSVEKIVFDHHGDAPPDWAPPDRVLVSEDAALSTTMASILAEREQTPTALEATALALGIHEDTGSLTYPGTTQRDADALGWCLRHGASQELVAAYLHTPLSHAESDVLRTLLDTATTVEVGGIDVLVAGAVTRESDVSVSTLAHKLVDLHDSRALACLVETSERVFCAIRSSAPELDAAAAAAILGGGGHAQAASATFRGTLEDARERLLAGLADAVREPLRARTVMSAPVRAVAPDDSVEDVLALCRRYGQSGALVMDGERLVGSVERVDLDKAVGHELAHAPVKGIMSSHPPTCDEETPVAELRRLLATTGEGRVAVVSGERVAGVVTRTDLLRALGAGAEEAAAAHATIAEELRRFEDLRPVFDAFASVTEDFEGVYLVGGTVRDILLGEQSFDVDVAVEGDAVAVAEAVAKALDGRIRAHRRFGTAVVLYGEAKRVDVVTARTEFYDAPAALPTVEHATIREDLFRRDFTINAMAASLKAEDFGRLVDPFGGRRDLEHRTIRILHNLSFIDDPTRIFRAIRYETRLGFRMSARTERLARACVEMGFVGDLSSARLGDELVALLEEREAGEAILRMAELGVDRAVHPHLAADEEAVELLDRLRDLRDRYGLTVPSWRLGLAVLARRLPPDELYDWLARLKVRRTDAERIAAAVTVAPRLVERVRTTSEPSEVVALAEPYAPDAPLFALALEPELRPLHDYFDRLRDVRLEIDGSDLAELGLRESPRVGAVLAELRRRKLNGELDGRDSELAAARELIG